MASKIATTPPRNSNAKAADKFSRAVEEFLDARPALADAMPEVLARIHASFDRPEVKIRVFDFAGSDEPMEPVLEVVAWCREDLATAIKKRKFLLDEALADLPLDALRHFVGHVATRPE
jgi:hypothetical protein